MEQESEVEFPVNPSQSRLLRKWAEGAFSSKIVEVLVAAPQGATEAEAVRAIRELVRAHEALRSRLVSLGSGRYRQRVVDCAEALNGLRVDRVGLGAGALEDHVTDVVFPPVEPAVEALRATVYLRGNHAVGVALSVSHVFADGIAQQVLHTDLHALLHGEAGRSAGAKRQASDFRADRIPGEVAENTAHWIEVAETMDVRYEDSDTLVTRRTAEVEVPARIVARLEAASRRLRVTPYVLWTAAASVLASAVTSPSRLTARLTVANRFEPADYRAVAQLSQAVYAPFIASPQDTLGDRVRTAMDLVMAAQDHGVHDTNAVVDRIEAIAGAPGCFRPDFEVNLVSLVGREGRLFEWLDRLARARPPDAAEEGSADAAEPKCHITVWRASGPTRVLIKTASPHWREEPAELARRLFTIADDFHRDPSLPVSNYSVSPASLACRPGSIPAS
ncbi:hypothetical protein ACIQWZ_38620 [Streptomyces sp. NPDC098077]|uniref:hypothetical protein n=1 Tax=Streptomyces sp. NPDC098077 TaxID=3366093 RepID=UPI0037FEE4E6